jgi:hypothetical protein
VKKYQHGKFFTGMIFIPKQRWRRRRRHHHHHHQISTLKVFHWIDIHTKNNVAIIITTTTITTITITIMFSYLHLVPRSNVQINNFATYAHFNSKLYIKVTTKVSYFFAYLY